MDKKRIEEIALEVARDTHLKSSVFCCHESDKAVVEFANRFLAHIDAARGKEAVDAVLLEDTVEGRHPAYGVGLFATLNCVRQVYRYPQTVIPEGYALVPIEPSDEMKESFYSNVVVLTTGTILGFNKGYSAMLAAAKEPRHD